MSRHSGKECSSPANDIYDRTNEEEEFESMNNDNSNDENLDDKINIEVDSCESPTEVSLEKLIESK